jgi:L-fucose isomerase-like protein
MAALPLRRRGAAAHNIYIVVGGFWFMATNVPEVKLGIISVSRDCFVKSLSERRVKAVADACRKKGVGDVFLAGTIVENEADMLKAVGEARSAGCNSLLAYLGNFGPETPETLIAREFQGPVMYAAAAEETGKDLINGRGDAYCGMLNCSYNLGLRKLRAVVPENPVGTAEGVADEVLKFIPVARALIGLSSLKIITFGPRPQDFFACNAPIKGLYDLGVEIQENSELDLLVAYRKHKGDPRIAGVVEDMAGELGASGNQYPDILPRMAQFELTLLDWAEQNKGARKYVAFANKCWPAFPTEFGFEPCYVNSRFAARGMPVSCEVDIYGALSEYIGACVTSGAVTLLDINNSVPADIYEADIKGKFERGYSLWDTFMGFHCGNTPFCKLAEGAAIKYQLIQNRLIENGGEPDVTRGTLEGDIAAGDITFYRLQANADASLQAYIAQGEILPVATRSFGGIGVFAIPDMARFYRHVLIEKRYPHHGAVAFGHVGAALFTIFRYLGVADIAYNQPKGLPYKSENPFA